MILEIKQNIILFVNLLQKKHTYLSKNLGVSLLSTWELSLF
jgi:hypothetical protein